MRVRKHAGSPACLDRPRRPVSTRLIGAVGPVVSAIYCAGFELVTHSMSAKDAQSFLSFQDLILRLQQYWAERGCVIMQPYDKEMGAGTFHPATFLRGSPADGRQMVAMAITRFACSITTSTRSSSSRRRTTSRTFTSSHSRQSASTRWYTTFASSRTTGSRRHLAPGAWAGRSG
jgi:hypothetical protein